MFPVFEKVKELAKKHGISLNTLEDNLGYGRNSLYSLKNKKPNAERLQEIADYFQVSTDYLLGRTDNPAIAKDGQEYTSDDLREMAKNAKTFDGKPVTAKDIEAIQNIIEIYLKGR
ncbi:helix-turn-helix transcriptional regulator [Streptococcus dysgalactiae]|uniref:helix-turn-helix domain-containing protein n=1 Tax=Streptococcus dysgalactiae TaxID=1334 RepID=UPI0035D1137F